MCYEKLLRFFCRFKSVKASTEKPPCQKEDSGECSTQTTNCSPTNSTGGAQCICQYPRQKACPCCFLHGHERCCPCLALDYQRQLGCIASTCPLKNYRHHLHHRSSRGAHKCLQFNLTRAISSSQQHTVTNSTSHRLVTEWLLHNYSFDTECGHCSALTSGSLVCDNSISVKQKSRASHCIASHIHRTADCVQLPNVRCVAGHRLYPSDSGAQSSPLPATCCDHHQPTPYKGMRHEPAPLPHPVTRYRRHGEDRLQPQEFPPVVAPPAASQVHPPPNINPFSQPLQNQPPSSSSRWPESSTQNA